VTRCPANVDGAAARLKSGNVVCPHLFSRVDLADANLIFTGDLFVNTNRYPMIDFGNGGDIRGMIRANEAFLERADDGGK
jgi:hypothetical protein